MDNLGTGVVLAMNDRSNLTHIHQFREALAAMDAGRPAGTLEAWLRLVASALSRPRMSVRPGDNLVGDVLGTLFERLLRLRQRSPLAWSQLLQLEEARLKGKLRKMAVRAALDLDPDRDRKRALAQLVGKILKQQAPASAAAPVAIRQGSRLSRQAVAAAVSWALALPDGPPRRPYAIACFLLRAYEPTTSLEGDEGWLLADVGDGPARSAEHAEHAARVARGLEVRLAPEEARALSLHLRGATLEAIAADLGCQRTKAQGLADRARREVAVLVAELEAEWRLL